MNKFKAFLTTLIFLSSTVLFAQNNEVEMADSLYQSGKIYVVVCVLAIIFTGIIAYLIILDRKITKLEKNTKNNN